MSIDFNQLRELLAAIAQTDITEFALKSEEFELTVRKDPTRTSTTEMELAPLTPSSPPLPKTDVPVTATAPEVSVPSPGSKKWVEITSPMVGTFYLAPAPGKPSFVEVGDTIRVGGTVCIIEAMKLMNEIEAEISGTLMEITVKNGQPVEFGQTLMRIDPS